MHGRMKERSNVCLNDNLVNEVRIKMKGVRPRGFPNQRTTRLECVAHNMAQKIEKLQNVTKIENCPKLIK